MLFSYVDMVDTTHPRRLNCGNLGGNHTCAVQHLFRFIMGSFVVLLQTTVLATTSTVPTVPTWRLVHNQSGRVNMRRNGTCSYLSVLSERLSTLDETLRVFISDALSRVTR